MKSCVLVFSAAVLLGSVASVSFGQATQESTRYGAFNALDSRSVYGKGFFPEPLGVDEGDVEDEVSLNWTHAERHGEVANEVSVEVEKSFGLLTIEVAGAYGNEVENEDGVRTRSEGIGNVEISARHPVFQYVSPNEAFDYTLVFSLEVALPTNTEISHDGEIVPVLQQLIRIGDHFSLQLATGYSTIVGPDDSGKETFEYSATAGWNIDEKDVPLPKFINRVTPLVELTGERALNLGDHSNLVEATIGVRVNFDAIGPLSPHLGVGYIIPLNDTARDEFRWGVITSFVFEY